MGGAGIHGKAGQVVPKGKMIATYAGGTQLHFGINNGTYHDAKYGGNDAVSHWLDPYTFMEKNT